MSQLTSVLLPALIRPRDGSWDANANRSEATRVATAGVRGPDGPGSRTFGLPIGATSGARRSIIIVCRRADPRRPCLADAVGGSGGRRGPRARVRNGSEPLCRPPSVEPRYNMNYLSNRNPNQPSELHCTPTRPRAVSSVADWRYRDSYNSLSRLNIHNRYISPARSHSCARSQVSSPPHSHSSGARR